MRNPTRAPSCFCMNGCVQTAWAGKEMLRQLLDGLPAVDRPLVINLRRDSRLGRLYRPGRSGRRPRADPPGHHRPDLVAGNRGVTGSPARCQIVEDNDHG